MRNYVEGTGTVTWPGLKPTLVSIRAGLKDPFDWPIRLWKVATADLPTFNEAEHEGAIAYDSTLDRLTYGNHTAWVTVMPYDAGLADLAALTPAQGDLIYGDAADSYALLAKDTNATRYLANTGTSNNPAWAQVNLTNGVTGDLPYSSLAQGSALSVLGVTGNATADNASIAAGSDHQVLRRSGTAVAFGAVNLAQSAAVTGTLPAGNGGTGVTSLGNITRLDDTNVTLTLGGTPTGAVITSTSFTLGWSGTLSVARGGIGVGTVTGLMQGNGTSAVTAITNSTTVGQVLRVTGSNTYAWGALDLADADAITGILPFANSAVLKGALVTKAADQTTADYTTLTAITWDSESYDTDGFHESVTNPSRLTVPSGVTKVRLTGGVHITSITADMWARIVVTKNGAFANITGLPALLVESGQTIANINIASPPLTVATNDYFELTLQVETDTSITVEAGTSWFAIEAVAA